MRGEDFGNDFLNGRCWVLVDGLVVSRLIVCLYVCWSGTGERGKRRIEAREVSGLIGKEGTTRSKGCGGGGGRKGLGIVREERRRVEGNLSYP